MKKDKQLKWIVTGYEMFSQSGLHGLNIESLARNVNKNKSSFYHYFGDLDSYLSELLKFHVERTKESAELAKKCEHMKPDVLNLFVDRKTDIFFHKQLRLNRSNPEFKECYEKSFQMLSSAFVDKWASFLGLDNQPLFAETFLNLIAENFLLRITEKTYNYQWLEEYLEEVLGIFQQMTINTKS